MNKNFTCKHHKNAEKLQKLLWVKIIPLNSSSCIKIGTNAILREQFLKRKQIVRKTRTERFLMFFTA